MIHIQTAIQEYPTKMYSITPVKHKIKQDLQTDSNMKWCVQAMEFT